ncbi:hypothetical protein AU252_01615 [Pseudarthrobacter sulfonivorans]|uniref:Uncharacterized protein n=1 Tax=Pseudarthrobacter sulfonivorans TaxID=121292 RepID=A0A0U3PCP8_9MICC|nr:hypothetical protein AU252_01615 [Pseudarthrobacter sulfonivorans]
MSQMLEDKPQPTKVRTTLILAADDRIGSNQPSVVDDHSHSLPIRRWQPHLVTQWSRLWQDEFVELRENQRLTATGRVDEVTDDGTTIWIHLSSGRGRKMLHSGDGVDIWRVDSRICQDRPQQG